MSGALQMAQTGKNEDFKNRYDLFSTIDLP
jgi:hypothetical protein